MDPDCELCAADRITEWFHEDELCWVAECEMCAVPMVVWKCHATDPSDELRATLHDRLRIAVGRFYDFEPWIDDNMRSIPTHYHAHARPRDAFYGHGRRLRSGPDLPDD